MSDKKKTALEQLREHLKEMHEELLDTKPGCGLYQTYELKIAHLGLILELAERVEALEAKQKQQGISFSFREKDNLRAYLNIKTNDARTIETPVSESNETKVDLRQAIKILRDYQRHDNTVNLQFAIDILQVNLFGANKETEKK